MTTTYDSIDHSDAMRIAANVVHTAEHDGGLPVAVVVMDIRGIPLVAICMTHAITDCLKYAHAKATSSLNWRQATADFMTEPTPEGDMRRGAMVRVPRDGAWDLTDAINGAVLGGITVWGGGVPITNRDGATVGSIGVSGRDATKKKPTDGNQDHELAQIGATAFFTTPAEGDPLGSSGFDGALDGTDSYPSTPAPGGRAITPPQPWSPGPAGRVQD